MQLSAPSRTFSSEPTELARGLAGLLRFFTQASDSDFLRQADELDLTLTQLKLLFVLYELPEPVAGEEPRSRSIDGSATFTTVLSSMIMKSAKLIAPSVHHFWFCSVIARRRAI